MNMLFVSQKKVPFVPPSVVCYDQVGRGSVSTLARYGGTPVCGQCSHAVVYFTTLQHSGAPLNPPASVTGPGGEDAALQPVAPATEVCPLCGQ